jgi:hypothetical protein
MRSCMHACCVWVCECISGIHAHIHAHIVGSDEVWEYRLRGTTQQRTRGRWWLLSALLALPLAHAQSMQGLEIPLTDSFELTHLAYAHVLN